MLIITTNSSTHYLFSCWFLCDRQHQSPQPFHATSLYTFALCIFFCFCNFFWASFLFQVSFCVFSSSFCCLLVCRKFHSFFKFHYMFLHHHFVAYLFTWSFVSWASWCVFSLSFCCLFICTKFCSFFEFHSMFCHYYFVAYLFVGSFVLSPSFIVCFVIVIWLLICLQEVSSFFYMKHFLIFFVLPLFIGFCDSVLFHTTLNFFSFFLLKSLCFDIGECTLWCKQKNVTI